MRPVLCLQIKLSSIRTRNYYVYVTHKIHKIDKYITALHYSWINEYLIASYLRQIIQQLNFDHVIYSFYALASNCEILRNRNVI